MHIKSFCICFLPIMILLSACMSMPPYTEMESELEVTRIQRDEAQKKLQNLQIKQKQTAERLQWMELQLSNSEAARRQLSKDLKKLQGQFSYLKKINRQQQNNIKTLELELEKRRSVIQLQGKVIQLLDDTKKTIETSLKDQIAAQDIEVVEVGNTLKVIFLDKILFDSGSVEINPGGQELLKLMADSLRENNEQDIVVEGHTDDVTLSATLRKRFPSNWELSTARASAVVHFFQQEGGIQPKRLEACGYSHYRPIAPNDTEKGRQQNRRIEIILRPYK